MTHLCFILGDQLCDTMPSLLAIDKQRDVVFLCEVREEAVYVKHHPKKIAFIFSAMRHFAEHLTAQGYRVRYTAYDDPLNTGSFQQELQRIMVEEGIETIHITFPGEWRVIKALEALQDSCQVPITWYEDHRFLCSRDEFKRWTQGKKQWRMEYFYRLMRQKHRILVDDFGHPVGGSWNYDAENRKNANHINIFPKRLQHPADALTEEVLALVAREFSTHFGQLRPFDFAVTREEALAEAHHFMNTCLHCFGDYQDAMLANESSLFHSRLSFYLNVGLLLPLELCQMAEQAYWELRLPLNAVEGFIRQILGWREYVRGIYWQEMPYYAERNYFQASRPLPEFYWGGDTRMFCMKEVVRQTAAEAYSHHIQRLMVTGNFALLAGLDPKAVCDWYLAVYADAFEWVELPNTLGMALYADGGIMASKPYAASGKYIQRMSNFCKSCYYSPKEVVGEKACPFNALYWNFLHHHESLLKDNPRMHYAYLNWQKMDTDKKDSILAHASSILMNLNLNEI